MRWNHVTIWSFFPDQATAAEALDLALEVKAAVVEAIPSEAETNDEP